MIIKKPCLHVCEGRVFLFPFARKKGEPKCLAFLSTELFGFDCTCRAVAYARTAVDAFTSVDNVNAAVFFDATCRAAACASATTDAFGTDFMSHWKHLLLHSTSLFYIRTRLLARCISVFYEKKEQKTKKYAFSCVFWHIYISLSFSLSCL